MEFLHTIFSGPMLVYSVSLCLMLLYWLIILIGLIDIESLDAVFGFGDALEGAGEVAGEAAAESAGDALAGAAAPGPLEAVLGFIGIGTVPVTIVGSILIITMWFLAFCLYYFVSPVVTHLAPPLIITLCFFLLSAFGSYFTTGLLTRPLRKVFTVVSTHAGYHLVGRTCKIRSSEVTEMFGEAELMVKDSFIIISVRCDEENNLKKGEEAVIIDYQKETHLYDVRKL
ncbi:MAG: DUF1449 family protein [Lentisphaeria bacterium]|nr:DUF1449 family protein [Lentisphaeria bacterium]